MDYGCGLGQTRIEMNRKNDGIHSILARPELSEKLDSWSELDSGTDHNMYYKPQHPSSTSFFKDPQINFLAV